MLYNILIEDPAIPIELGFVEDIVFAALNGIFSDKVCFYFSNK